MSRRKSTKRTPGRASAILGAFKDIRFDFVLVVIIVTLYVSAATSLSLEKVIILLLGPVIAELALLGLDAYIIGWVRKALPIRSLIAAGFGIAIGSAIILMSSASLIFGAVIIVLSILLIVYSLWRYRTTKDLGVKTADPLGMINVVIFMTALLVYVLGYFEFSVILVACSLIVLVHASLPFSVFLTMMVAGIVQSIYGNAFYTVLIVVVEGLVQGYMKRAEIISRIKNASPLRTLITSTFGVAIGSTLIITSPVALVVGILFLNLSLLLATYGVSRYLATRDLGIRKQDPIGTVNLIILLTSILTLILGVLNVFAILFSCWILIFLYRQLIFEIPLMLTTAFLVQGLFQQLTYTLVIIIVGIVMSAIGIVLKHVEAEKIRSISRAKAAASKENK